MGQLPHEAKAKACKDASQASTVAESSPYRKRVVCAGEPKLGEERGESRARLSADWRTLDGRGAR